MGLSPATTGRRGEVSDADRRTQAIPLTSLYSRIYFTGLGWRNGLGMGMGTGRRIIDTHGTEGSSHGRLGINGGTWLHIQACDG